MVKRIGDILATIALSDKDKRYAPLKIFTNPDQDLIATNVLCPMIVYNATIKPQIARYRYNYKTGDLSI